MLALYYTAVSIAHALILADWQQRAMVTVASASALALLLIWVSAGIRRPKSGLAHRFEFLISLIVMLNCLIHLLVDPDPKHTTNVALALIGGGLLFFSLRGYVAFVGLTVVGWLCLVPHFEPSDEIVHYGFVVGSAACLSGVAFALRRRALIELEGSRLLSEEIELRRQAEAAQSRLQEQLFHADKMSSLGVMAAGLAHDFNNVLAAISLNAELGGEDTSLGEIRRRFKEIELSSDRAARLTKEMLTFSGKSKATKEPFDLAEAVQHVHMILASPIAQAIDVQLPAAVAPPIVIDADRSQVEQVAMNLLINGVEALESEAGRVSIAVGEIEVTEKLRESSYLGNGLGSGPHGYLRVVDNGVGIKADNLQRVFDPFYSTKFSGRGLGLASVAGIVQAHSGAIHLKSQEGKGTSFTILLPLSCPQLEAGVRLDDSDYRWDFSGLTALVIDDEPAVADLVATVLKGAGFNVETAYGGEPALATIRHLDIPPNLVLVDATMPQVGGRALISKIRSIHPGVQVILMSGYEANQETDNASAESSAFLHKPFTRGELLAAVRGVLQGRERSLASSA